MLGPLPAPNCISSLVRLQAMQRMTGGAVKAWGAALQGGAIRTQNTTTVAVTGSQFEDNSAENGGAIYLNNCTEALVADSHMNSNTAQQQGGALFQVPAASGAPGGQGGHTPGNE